MTNLIDEGNKKNRDDLIARGYTKGACCQNCTYTGDFPARDRVGCRLLNWTYGNQVIPTNICIAFEYKVTEHEE